MRNYAHFVGRKLKGVLLYRNRLREHKNFGDGFDYAPEMIFQIASTK